VVSKGTVYFCTPDDALVVRNMLSFFYRNSISFWREKIWLLFSVKPDHVMITF
jgi:hypothetical protein